LKKSRENLFQSEITADKINFKSIKTFGTRMVLKGQKDKFSLELILDSINSHSLSVGASSIGIDVLDRYINGYISIKDNMGKPVYQLGAEMLKQKDRIILRTSASEWVLNSKVWTISAGEILSLETSTRDLSADIHLQHNQMKVDMYGQKSKNLHLDFQNVLLSMLVPPEFKVYRPDGTLNANITFSDDGRKNLDFNCDITQIKWSDIAVRHLFINGKILADTSEIIESSIIAQINDTASIKVDFGSGKNTTGKLFQSTFNDIPIPLLEPLIRKYADQLHGSVSGAISFSKFDNKVSLDGEVKLKETAIRIIPLNANFSIPDEKIEINKNQMSFNRFMILDSMKRRLYVNGNINMSDPNHIIADLQVNSDNLQIMNTRVKDNPLFFGSIFINSAITITESLSNPVVKGSVALESGTNITYRYIGDASVSETQKVITFAKLNGDRLAPNEISPQQKKLAKMPTIQTSIEINPKSVFNFEISSGFDVGVKISGNGFLNYAILPNNTMSLAGSYEIQQGTSELKMVGWPRKYFTITPGSTVRWNGKIEDPEINLEATSRVRGSYENPIDNKNRDVDFFVSMKLANQLSDVIVVFDVKSPDQYISSVLNTLSPEERMRQAVNLLLFEGIDLPDIKSKNSYLTSQINGFWENQLNSMTKSNVKKVNLSFGIDSYTETSASGGEQDYTSLKYELEKKLMNNRISLKLSGRVNDTKQAGETSNNMIENFTLEYALDTLNSKYLKLYQNKDYEDILEGEVIKSGVGFIYRKTYDGIKEIWQRKGKKLIKQKPESSGKEK
jgi:translocation and assembly module TamB